MVLGHRDCALLTDCVDSRITSRYEMFRQSLGDLVCGIATVVSPHREQQREGIDRENIVNSRIVPFMASVTLPLVAVFLPLTSHSSSVVSRAVLRDRAASDCAKS